MKVFAVARALPEHYYDQQTLVAAFRQVWGERFFNVERLEQIHRNVRVAGRYLALPMEAYARIDSFSASNQAFIDCATELAARAVTTALQRAHLDPADIDHLMFVSSTGVATPSIDARLVNRLGLREDIKRSPLFGLGCVAGVAGIARLADYLRAYPNQVAVLVSVELCSLTLQRQDLSIANIISSGLFGDGAAAVVLAGAERARPPGEGPTVEATRSVFYPDTERVMGWDIGSDGFKVVLSSQVPELVQRFARRDVDAFLSTQALTRDDLACVVCHPGGPRVLEALQQALELPRQAFDLSWRSLESVGNLSSASVLLVLEDTMTERRPESGSFGLMMAMGPGFCSELVLLRW